MKWLLWRRPRQWLLWRWGPRQRACWNLPWRSCWAVVQLPWGLLLAKLIRACESLPRQLIENNYWWWSTQVCWLSTSQAPPSQMSTSQSSPRWAMAEKHRRRRSFLKRPIMLDPLTHHHRHLSLPIFISFRKFINVFIIVFISTNNTMDFQKPKLIGFEKKFVKSRSSIQ